MAQPAKHLEQEMGSWVEKGGEILLQTWGQEGTGGCEEGKHTTGSLSGTFHHRPLRTRGSHGTGEGLSLLEQISVPRQQFKPREEEKTGQAPRTMDLWAISTYRPLSAHHSGWAKTLAENQTVSPTLRL